MPYLAGRYPHIYSLDKNTPESFLWSYYTIKSRAFDVSTGNQVLLGMVPMIDLANHGHAVVNNNELRMQKPSNVLSYVVRAPVDIRGGTELLQTYSKFVEHSRHLYNYGFLDGDLTHTDGDFLALSATATERRPVFSDGVVPNVFLESLMESKGLSKTAALAAVLEAVKLEIQKLPTTLAEDLDALEKHKNGDTFDFDGADGLSLILRCRFKRILDAIVASATEALAEGTVSSTYGTVAAHREPVDARFAYFEIQL